MSGSILIVARNSLALTKKAVNSALRQDVPCDVLVINNASTDGTANWLRTKPVSSYTMPSQAALAKCWNVGIHTLMHLGFDKVLVINNDVEIPTYFHGILDDTDYPFVSGVSVDSPFIPFEPAHTMAEYCTSFGPHPDFSAFMISRPVVEKVGMFNEKYFPAYVEDNEFHVRMHRAGIRAGCIDLPFYHVGAQTLKSSSWGEGNRIKRGADKNRERFRRTYGCLPSGPEYDKLFDDSTFGIDG